MLIKNKKKTMSVQQKNLPMQLAREPFVQSSPWNSVLHFLMFLGVLGPSQPTHINLHICGGTHFAPIAGGKPSSWSNSLRGCSFACPEASSV